MARIFWDTRHQQVGEPPVYAFFPASAVGWAAWLGMPMCRYPPVQLGCVVV